MMVVKVGRSADKHCLRRELGMGSRSQKVLKTEENKLIMVGVCLAAL